MAGRKEQNSVVGMMIDEDGKLVKDLESKLNIFASYYTKLYKSLEPTLENINRFLDMVHLLLEEYKSHLDADIIHLENERAILHLKVGKFPGLDGLTVELYRAFKDDLISYLQELFKFCVKEGRTPPSWQQVSDCNT